MIGKLFVLPTLMLVLAMLSSFPITMGRLKFVPIYNTLIVKANKKFPPHIAYLESYRNTVSSEWSEFEKKAKHNLAVGLPENITQQGPYVFTQRRDLEGFVIHKTNAQETLEAKSAEWLKNIVREPRALAQEPAEEPLHNLQAAKRVTGSIEITGGLAVTNEHHIEVRRADEGVFREMGRVDLMKGSYSIDVDEAAGDIVARLVNKSGAILGEGSVRLSQLPSSNGRLVYGPRIEISPSPTSSGAVSHYYSDAKNEKAIPTQATTFGGQNPVPVGKNGEVLLENVVKNSSTVIRANSPGHMPSSKIVVAGARPFGVTLFPNSMIEALKSIVEDKQSISRSELAETTVVWGTITLDGKPLSGVAVTSETEPEAQAIYFNEFMIPDPKLTATSSSGLYAFVDLQKGLHALLGQRGEAYFGHQNVDVEVGSVAIGDIENTLRTEPVRIRAFDAFSGGPVTVTASLQSLSQPIDVAGSATVVLPQVSRLSIIYTEAPPNYVSANYFYNDQAAYIHLPMISQEWLAEIKAAAKINDFSQTGTIIGFFGEENFEVYLANQIKEDPTAIVYFDATGRVVDGRQGVSGGGFVMFNVPSGVQETVVLGRASAQIFSKVVPVDTETVSVLNFTSY